MARPPARKKPVKEKRDVPMSFRIKPSLKDAVDEVAETEQRTVSRMVEMLLEERCGSEGF
jgi:hypothetical protein